jgi:hypothetical protein
MQARAVLLAVVVLLSLPLLAAVPVCPQATLATYIAMGTTGCAFENAVFANFSYAGSAGSPTANQITVIPVSSVSPVVGCFAGLNYAAPWGTGAKQTESSQIRYTVTPNATTSQSGVLTLDLGKVQLTGAVAGVTVTEATNVGTLTVYEQCQGTCTLKQTSQLAFAPLQALQVTDTVTLSAGMGGSVALGSFATNYNFCPLCTDTTEDDTEAELRP